MAVVLSSDVKCPVWDQILVEKCSHPRTESQVRYKIKYCVPDGTLKYTHRPYFYQYQIPNGIPTQ